LHNHNIIISGKSLLKPHDVHTAWLHKIAPSLIVCIIYSINSIRNLRPNFADNRLSFWSHHCWFMIQDQSWSVPMAHLWLLFKNIGYQEENYNFWDFFTTICDIKCRLWMKLAPALVPLEAWLFWNKFHCK
jgi:hypothetical protein